MFNHPRRSRAGSIRSAGKRAGCRSSLSAAPRTLVLLSAKRRAAHQAGSVTSNTRVAVQSVLIDDSSNTCVPTFESSVVID